MQQVIHIFQKEFKDYFVSPIGYIVISIFLMVTGWFFFSTYFLINQANLRNFFELLPITFSFVIPAITMRLFSEELNVGSYETLMTMPVTINDVIIGKFLAGVAFVAAILLPTVSYALFTALLGDLDFGPVIGGYAGSILLGGAFTAIGIFASALTRNQIIAFIVGMIICFTMTLMGKMLFFIPASILSVINYMGVDVHFRNISRGIIDSRDIIYFLSVTFIGLYCANLAMQEKK